MHGAVAPTSAVAARRRRGARRLPVRRRLDAAGRDTLDRGPRRGARAGGDVRVGGLPAQNADFIRAVYGNFPLMIALIAVVTFILLARRSARCSCR